MSLDYNKSEAVPIEILCDRLDELSDAITKGRDSTEREFCMRIPAEVDRDADLVLAEAARRLRLASLYMNGNRAGSSLRLFGVWPEPEVSE